MEYCSVFVVGQILPVFIISFQFVGIFIVLYVGIVEQREVEPVTESEEYYLLGSIGE